MKARLETLETRVLLGSDEAMSANETEDNAQNISEVLKWTRDLEIMCDHTIAMVEGFVVSRGLMDVQGKYEGLYSVASKVAMFELIRFTSNLVFEDIIQSIAQGGSSVDSDDDFNPAFSENNRNNFISAFSKTYNNSTGYIGFIVGAIAGMFPKN